jgi:hypothetical protein
MTIHQIIKELAKEEVFIHLTVKAQSMIANAYEGLQGLGEASDESAKEYLTEKQIDYIKKIGKRYLK